MTSSILDDDKGFNVGEIQWFLSVVPYRPVFWELKNIVQALQFAPPAGGWPTKLPGICFRGSKWVFGTVFRSPNSNFPEKVKVWPKTEVKKE